MALVGGLVAGAAVLTVAVATAGVTHKKAGADVCFLLPDTKTSIRWEQFDRPAMAKALKAAGAERAARGGMERRRVVDTVPVTVRDAREARSTRARDHHREQPDRR